MSNLDILRKNTAILSDGTSFNDGSVVYRNASRMLKAGPTEQNKTLIEEMFLWAEKERSETVSDLDAALVALTGEDLSEREQIVLARRQKKARKRLKKAKRANVQQTMLNRRFFDATTEAMEADYDSAIEALTVAAAIGSLLEPDQIADFMLSTIGSKQTWKPVMSPANIYSATHNVFDIVEDTGKRLKLVQSMWDIAHTGRWWDKTSGDFYGGTSLKYLDLADPEPVEPAEEYTAATLKTALQNGTAHYIDQAIAVARKMRIPETDYARIHRISNGRVRTIDPMLLISHMDISSLYKPVTPVNDLCGILNERSAEQDLTEGWKEADSWEGLFPPDVGTGFEISNRIMKLNGIVIDGHHFQVITTAADLRRNANQMGNCTYGRLGGLRDGNSTMWRIYHNGRLFNAQTGAGNRGTREIQGSSKNGGYGIPAETRDTWERFLGRMS